MRIDCGVASHAAMTQFKSASSDDTRGRIVPAIGSAFAARLLPFTVFAILWCTVGYCDLVRWFESNGSGMPTWGRLLEKPTRAPVCLLLFSRAKERPHVMHRLHGGRRCLRALRRERLAHDEFGRAAFLDAHVDFFDAT